MKAYISFTRKEFTENTRNYKLFIMGIVFVVLGIMNPVVAKITPTLLESLSIEGMVITIPTPTALDSWAQFFANVSQMGLLTLLIVFSGIMASELSRGTLINMLTKGLKRSTVILSKFTAASAIWTAVYLLCFAVTYYYTAYFWPMEGMHNVFLTFFSLWLFGILLIALLIFGGVLFKRSFASLLLAGGMLVVMTLMNIHPKLQKFNPITLSSSNYSLLIGQITPADFLPAIIICTGCIVALVAASIFTFNKKQL